ncbi:O-succinylhomoserine sulfhydrylase [Abyssibacter profundi]|uniref:O-succinylhomoserine sulfhydrylase n=1 Tax=Abyssibacter profundi TaxID=2182787 RepID=A0A363UK47_9GAMM|nr:O-succinylhomoserine sulfhydrylase [Abyssibacter profundi]MBV61836.1 O-succinylhomoserine sulfhydrylase [Nevskiales bacterium]PWN55774.1 O-succinylhomoserine sulfhydrylase [Abyssibacter profundi]
MSKPDRPQDIDPNWGTATLGVRAGEMRSEFGEHSAAIHATSSFVFESAEAAAKRFSGEEPGLIYSRFTNPTVQGFERKLAAMEGGDQAVATASGMSAILSLLLATLRAGDHLVAAKGLFGSTTGLLNNIISRFDIAITYVAPSDTDAWRQAVQPNTRLFMVESPTNPLCELADIAALAQIARDVGVLLAVDNCFCTPALQQPLALGAHVVLHSATKFLDGQGRAVGGAVVGDSKLVGEDVFGIIRTAGPCMSPFNAWVFLKGLETLDVRMRAHCQRAEQVAGWLAEQPAVDRVYYTGLSTHPQHALACRQQSGHGAIVAFDLKGGQAAAFNLINATRLFSITANLGDVRSTITHPPTTTHYRIGPELRAAAGIQDGLVRLSIGLEDAGDLIADLQRGL